MGIFMAVIDKRKALSTFSGAAVIAALVSLAAPALAQAVTVPTLSFPKAGTDWGCQFYATCEKSEQAVQ